MTTKQIVIIAYAAYLVLLSLITFIAYGVDKKKAKSGKWRTKENTIAIIILRRRLRWLSSDVNIFQQEVPNINSMVTSIGGG